MFNLNNRALYLLIWIAALVCFAVLPAYAADPCSIASFNVAPRFDVGTNPRFAAVGDFNGDGKPDLAVANGGSNNVSILLGKGTGSFDAATNFDVASAPYAVAVGDFNGDGKLDLATANNASNNVSILLGTGTGSFAPAVNSVAGTGPFSIAVGNFNSDGKPDLAVANKESNNVSILLGDGSGGFSAATNFTVGSSPRSVAIGDFNSDGKPDLVTANFNPDTVSILLGNGAGGFGAATDFSGGVDPSSVALGDFNGDSHTDLAVTNSSNHVSVLLGNGVGAFGTVTKFAVGINPLFITVGDLNGDSKPDLVTANYVSDTVSILLGNGTGGFGAATDYAVGNTPSSVAVSDFNGDGKVDLAVSNIVSNNISLLSGNGTGDFAAPSNFTTMYNPVSVALGDFNADGRVDLAVLGAGSNGGFGAIAILLGDGAGRFGAATYFGAGVQPTSIIAGDFNGDGRLDLATANNGSASLGGSGVSILLGDGTGGFGPATNFFAGQTPFSLVTGDFNKDGKADLAVANSGSNNVSIFLGDGAGNFGTASNFAVGTSPRFIATADLNGDGKADLVTTSNSSSTLSILLGNGAGGFVSGQTITTSGPVSIAIGDVNGDGKPDLAVVNSSKVSTFLGDGTGNFSTPAYFTASTGGSGAVSIALGDFNGDSKTDFVVANRFSNNVSVMLGDGTGSFGAASNFGVATQPRFVAVGDLNGDGKPDIITPNSTSQNVSVLLNNSCEGVSTPTSSLSINNVNITEGNVGTTNVNFLVSLSSASGQPISVAYETLNGTAISGSDYIGTSGTLTFNPGETAKTISVTVNGDVTFEPDETFTLTLTNPINASLATAVGTGTILNDDNNVAGSLQFSAANYSVSEGAGAAAILITRTNGSSGAVSVSYATSNGTATAGIDYTATSGILTFADGELTRTINVPVQEDSLYEGNEFINLTLSNPTNNSTLGSQSTATLTIVENDPQPAALQLDQSIYNVAEGTGSLNVLVNRSGDPSPPLTVNYTTSDAAAYLQECKVINGQATSRCDYVAVVGTLHFASGETSKTISIPIVDDTYAEGAENLFITLSNPSGGGATLGATRSATISISDNGNDGSGAGNPIDDKVFFVREHYIDFLSREPDPASSGWLTQLNGCGAGDQSCRLAVSQGIYGSPEFKDRGYFIYKFFSVALGRKPSYDEFNVDRARVSGFQTPAELEQSKVDFITDFMGRAEFASLYNPLSNYTYVQRLFDTAGVTQITVGGVVRTFTTEQQMLAGGTISRAQVLRDIAESQEASARFLTESTVVMHYFGYLRRDPDAAYQNWITILTTTGDSRNVTDGFVNSQEYRARFGQ